MEEKIIEWAHKNKLSIAIDSIQQLPKAEEKIADLINSGWYHRSIMPRWTKLADGERTGLDVFKSLIILSLPRPAHLVSFKINDKSFNLLLPPTYFKYNKIFHDYFSLFENEFGGEFGSLKLLVAPLKTLAADIGLTSYGKNNVTYIESSGSYHQLIAFLIEKKLQPYKEPTTYTDKMLPQCKECNVCKSLCPTKSITDQRFQIKADTCLTYFNEREGELPSVDSIPTKLEPCLLGCMVCQEFCPANKGMLRIERSGVEFNSYETDALLNGAGDNNTMHAVEKKINELGISDNRSVLNRNIKFALSIAKINGTSALKYKA